MPFKGHGVVYRSGLPKRTSSSMTGGGSKAMGGRAAGTMAGQNLMTRWYLPAAVLSMLLLRLGSPDLFTTPGPGIPFERESKPWIPFKGLVWCIGLGCLYIGGF